MSAPKKSYWEKKLATIAFYSRPIFCRAHEAVRQ
jgi:hypothetical protein